MRSNHYLELEKEYRRVYLLIIIYIFYDKKDR